MRHGLMASLAGLLVFAGGASAADAPAGALSCTGCHGAPSVPKPLVPALSGRPAVEIGGIMREFKSHARPATVMGRIALGFSDAEIDAIAEWFAKQGN
jgi:cytochrome subunit of sulfide dehydrogenase